jgi:cellulose synthase/poly-beta-1,6-N-acetylglucosamine synthase-like glycosyltransferase
MPKCHGADRCEDLAKVRMDIAKRSKEIDGFVARRTARYSAQFLGLLVLIPPLLVTLGHLGLILKSPPPTVWAGTLATVVVLLRACNHAQQIVDTFWRLLCFREPTLKKPIKSLPGDCDLPTVDIIITACWEPLDVIMDTTRAACGIDYLHSRYRVVVADDGNDPRLRRCVLSLKEAKRKKLSYYAREKSILSEINPKACNINSTLKWLEQSGSCEGRSEWFAVLDCDMMPESNFLPALLRHAVHDPQIAMAVPPQNYYNDPLYQTMEVQNTLDEPVRNSFRGTWCAGSGFLARRTAIDAIGGFPTSSLCEDILCGFLLNGQGWRVLYVDQPLQWGLVPGLIDAHIAQRRRWAVGSIQNAKILKLCCSRKMQCMSVAQRLAAFSYCFAPFVQYITQPLLFLLLPWSFILAS